MKPLRLDKYLADMGSGTRSEVRLLIKKGLVTVDGVFVKEPDMKVLPGVHKICLNGADVGYTEFEYLMLNKPAGVVSATEDKKEKTVLDLIGSNRRKDLFPVGRLDKDTQGLLLITNDGELAHQLLSPKRHVAKVYKARILGMVTEEDAEAFAGGIQVDKDFKALPAKLHIIQAGPVSEVEIEIYEGKFHQIKRMFEATGKKVIELKRLSMGPLVLDEALPEGKFRPLTKEELAALKNR